MRHRYLILPLLLPFCAFGHQPDSSFDPTLEAGNPFNKNSIVKSYSNELEESHQKRLFERSVDYPTQIIRMSHSLVNQQLNCTQVNDLIDKTLVQIITSDKFTYNFYIACSYDPETKLATEFLINSYFDPMNDEAIEYLNNYLAKFNGSDFLGTKLNIESAKALIISLNFSAGIKKNPSRPPFIEYQKDRSNYYFSSNYEMKKTLIADIYQNFFSNDPEKILPFLNKWLFSSAEIMYSSVLKDSNFTELQPERIFLMNEGNELFVSKLKYYFAHNCTKHENHRCLANGATS
jgi:hypothetical protein